MLIVLTTGSSVASSDKELGFKQSFLRGHSNPVGLIEVSSFVVLLTMWSPVPPVGACCCPKNLILSVHIFISQKSAD